MMDDWHAPDFYDEERWRADRQDMQKERRLEKQDKAVARLREIGAAGTETDRASLDKISSCRSEDLKAICASSHVCVSGIKDELVLRVYLLCKFGGPGSLCRVCRQGKQEFTFTGTKIKINATPGLKCRHKRSEASRMCPGEASCVPGTSAAIRAKVETFSAAAAAAAAATRVRAAPAAADAPLPPKVDQWVQCNICNRWRRLGPDVDVDALPDVWECKMNADVDRDYCDAPEEGPEAKPKRRSRREEEEDEDFVPTKKAKGRGKRG